MRYPKADTLVAFLPARGDFTIAQRDHWYRIPCRSAPEVLSSAKWLAFYFPASFGELKRAIHFYAAIVGVDQVVRRDLLPDQPDHPRADDPYFRVRIGDLHRLEHPVPSARRRRNLVFIPTTLNKLLRAREINDLYHDSPLEDRFWQALCAERIVAERQYDVGSARTRYCLDFAVFCRQGKLDVECDGDTWHLRPDAVASDNARNNYLASLGWLVLRFSSRELDEANVGKAVQQVRETSERYGGIDIAPLTTRRISSSGVVVDQYRLW